MSRAFRQLQIADEATPGTGVVGTSLAVGKVTVTPMATKHSPEDEDGNLAMRRRIITIARKTEMQYEADATYEQIVWLLSACLKGTKAGTGSAADKTWAFTPNLKASNGHVTWTLTYGTPGTDRGWRSAYCLVTSMELKWEADGVLTVTADMFGRFPTRVTLASLTSSPVNEILGNQLKVYIDNTWSTMGDTLKTSLVTAGRIRFNSGLTPAIYADGSLDFSKATEDKRSMELELSLTDGSDSDAEYGFYEANSLRAVRLLFEGATIGTTSVKNSLQVDILGHYTQDPRIFDERDGENILQFRMESATDGMNEVAVEVVNSVGTLP